MRYSLNKDNNHHIVAVRYIYHDDDVYEDIVASTDDAIIAEQYASELKNEAETELRKELHELEGTDWVDVAYFESWVITIPTIR